MDLFAPHPKKAGPGGSVYFSGKASETDRAKVLEISGDIDARVYLERSSDSGDTWETVSQFPSGDLSLSWHTTEIQPVVAAGVRRIRVDNAGDTPGRVELIGEEK